MVTITDRTELDVIYGTAKGFYNVSDINRVETNVLELYNELKSFGVDVPTLTIKTDWQEFNPSTAYMAITDDMWFTSSQAERYLTNIHKLAIILMIQDKVDLPSSMHNLTFEGANNIEKALEIIERYGISIPENWIYCGEIQSGEDWFI